jgi:hypothetical protein
MGDAYVWRIYVSLFSGTNTSMVKSLKEKHSCIQPTNIRAFNSTWIGMKLLPINSVDLNISNETLNIILEDKFRIKTHQMQL